MWCVGVVNVAGGSARGEYFDGMMSAEVKRWGGDTARLGLPKSCNASVTDRYNPRRFPVGLATITERPPIRGMSGFCSLALYVR